MLQFLGALAAAVPALLMAQKLWRVWGDPRAGDHPDWVRSGIAIFLMEFIIIHSGVFFATTFGPRAETPVTVMVGLCAFYLLFAAIIGWAFRVPGLTSSFVMLMIGRAVFASLFMTARDFKLLKAHSLTGFILYMFCIFLGLTVLPRRGMKTEIVRPMVVGCGSGAWIEQPHTAIGGAAVYFALLGLIELAVFTWIKL